MNKTKKNLALKCKKDKVTTIFSFLATLCRKKKAVTNFEEKMSLKKEIKG